MKEFKLETVSSILQLPQNSFF